MRYRSLIALAAGALLLGGCVAPPYYYDRYAYDNGYYGGRYGYYDVPPAYYGPPYYYPYYVAPSLGLSFSYGTHGHWHGHGR